MKKVYTLLAASLLVFASCKKEGCTDPTASNYYPEADKDDGSCTYAEVGETGPSYTTPSTFVFTDADGNSTVSYSGQEQRLDQLGEMTAMMKSGNSQVLDAQALKDMFANTGGDGAGNFSFTSSKQLKNKCFDIDQPLFEGYLDSIANASVDYAMTAANGQAGTLSSGTSTYLFDANGIEYVQIIEKGLMGAVFMHQALNNYFSDAKMDVDNTTAVDPGAGKYYTAMEHHWDEAFGYFGVPIDFPDFPATRFWGKYCMSQDANLNSNAVMMNNFLKGRAAITADEYGDRDAAIQAIRIMWEDISANQAVHYLDGAISNFGTDNAKALHEVAEAYAFARNLRYANDATRRMTQAEVNDLVNMFGTNFWELTVQDLQDIKATIQAIY